MDSLGPGGLAMLQTVTKTGENVTRRLGRRIAELRRHGNAGLVPQKEFADRVGISVSALRKIEQGTRSPSLARLVEIATELGVSLHELVCDPCASDDLPTRAKPLIRLVRSLGLTVDEVETLARAIQWMAALARPPGLGTSTDVTIPDRAVLR